MSHPVIDRIGELQAQGKTGPEIFEKMRPWDGGDQYDVLGIMEGLGYSINRGWPPQISDHPVKGLQGV